LRTGRILVTGGAGSVGAGLAVALAQKSRAAAVIAFDDLSGAESRLNAARLSEAGVEFVQGDVREKDALMALGHMDAILDCTSEHASADGSPGTALMGAYHSLELARRDNAQLIYLSTSSVYPARHLREINTEETETRFEISHSQQLPGVSPAGISEEFPLWGVRRGTGATKLAAEHLIEDYIDGYGVRCVINRVGAIAGPGIGIGVFARWMLAHYRREPLAYTGFGGSGKQVRDLIHIDDIADLIALQLAFPDEWSGHVGNLGGGRAISLSLRETTELCAEIAGNSIDVGSSGETDSTDVPVYISDCSLLFERTDWRPARDAQTILTETFEWLRATRRRVRG
jgi:CDP-paratose 2-epimerase